MNTMRALAVDPGQHNSRVVNAPIPTPRAGQILVEVKVTAVNEMDVQVRNGGWAGQVKAFRKDGPVLTGFEFVGVVRSDGRRIRAGQRVIGYSPVLDGPRTHAAFVAIDESAVHPIPDSLADEPAAALVVMGLSAIEVLERICPVERDQKVLVIGAAGGLGVYCVQLAAGRDADVTAIASRANAGWLMEQGARRVRAYESDPAFQPGDAFDLIIDAPAQKSFRKAAPYLARRGMYVSSNPTTDVAGFVRASMSSRRAGYLMLLKADPDRLDRLVTLAVAGALRPAIDSVFTLNEAEDAFARFETRGKQGRVLIRI